MLRLDPFRGLLAIAEAMRAESDLQSLLETIAQTVSATLGFGTVVVNLHRPAWDDFQVVVVHGCEAARTMLLGQTTTLPDWSPLFQPRFARHGIYLIPHGEFDWKDDRVASYVPELPPREEPDAWDPEDALLVPLRSSTGALLGVVSVDEPVDGLRPGDAQLEVLSAVAAHAGLAIEHAQAAAEGARHRRAVEHLLRVSAQLNRPAGVEEALEAVCTGIRDALGFEQVAVFLADRARGDLVAQANVGQGVPSHVPLEAIAELVLPGLESDSCVLLTRQEAVARTPPEVHGLYVSTRNGRGPLAWNRHWLLIPLHDREGRLSGLVWVDDPTDRLLPTPERLQALRAFANQASSAVESARQLQEMRHLAEHDPLTGLQNRRAFGPGLKAHLERAREDGTGLALLVCDLDHFKRVNDSLGHDAGDVVLRRFATVLRQCSRASDLPTRLGGEEFALVLPGADRLAAVAVAERLRATLRVEFAGFPLPVSASIGVAITGPGVETAAEVVRAANRAMYAAKRLGRDRCMVHEARTLEMLEALEEGDGAGREQLAAAMLLAETLDMRDMGTSRHSLSVAAYTERIAAALGLPPRRVARLRAAGMLHDIGKLGISDAVLHKPGGLDAREREEIERHPELGARILEHANLRDIGAWVLHHHERIDGAGYPHGLAGEEIPLEARILAVADAYEAMTADRPYRSAIGQPAARAELRREAGRQFDREVVDAFLRVLRHEPALAPPGAGKDAAAGAGAGGEAGQPAATAPA